MIRKIYKYEDVYHLLILTRTGRIIHEKFGSEQDAKDYATAMLLPEVTITYVK